jgi:uncharacterized protein YndB with AHSA1/START domain
VKIATCDRIVAAPPEVLWTLLTTVDGFNSWMSIEAEIDPTPGGIIRWVHDNGWVVAGEFRDVVPMTRLSFTFGWERGGFPVELGSSIVTIDLVPVGDGTEVRLRHEGLTPEMAAQHTHGWAMFIDLLVARADDRNVTA